MNATQRILLVEDDKPLRMTLATTLKAEGYAVAESGSVTSARQHLTGPVDLIVLDLGLPDADGMSLLLELRAAGDLRPILVLTARDDEAAKVRALDEGADDYVTKPFGVPELLARVRSALRHSVQSRGAPSVVVRVGDVEIDLARRSVLKAGSPVRLSRKEFDLLAELAVSVGRPVSHERLLEAVWGSSDADIRYLRVYIGQLREKIETDPQRPNLLISRAGFGYELAAAIGPTDT